jgi:hypothetical protein
LTAIKEVQAKEKGFIYDLQTKPFSLFDKRDFFSGLLDRRGGLWRVAEGDETEAGVVDFLNLIPPPRRAKFASLICLGTPPVQEGSLCWKKYSF